MAVEVLEKGYDPAKVEDKWSSHWINNGFFKADVNDLRKTFSIVIPPPNVTGSLHMGHALNNTLQDILARFKRMAGFNVLWMPGTDHAGIATQNVVERELAQKGISRHSLGREEFIEHIWKWREEFGGIIINQLKKLGASCDWSRERFTMDEGLSRAVREVFVELYNEKLIYRGDYIINWCPRCQTALSDLEVEHEETEGYLYYLKYPLYNSKKFVVVATTRPETMLGDTAVAVNPNDERYKKLIGKTAVLPVIGRQIPVIADEYVNKDFGTGAVKVTPAHDVNDFEMGLRHNLEAIRVMDVDGRMNDNAGPYKGLDRFRCRKEIIEEFQKSGTLKKRENYSHNIGHCYRCKVVIEPTLSKQWFVKVKPLADVAIEAVKDGRVRIIPASWEKTYFEWMNNIRDWCISRQIWWGHRIPAWYCNDCGEVIVSKDDPTQCSKCLSSNISQETDVLDTWFSSALWPFSTMGWPEQTKELELFYPTSVLVTGFDILFFWVARMMMMGIKFMDKVPFEDVYIHALVRDIEGKKMSKSKGNVIDPLVIIEKYGADAFRFTLAAFAAQGRDIKLSEERIGGYRNFANKIWNASRFSLMNMEGYDENLIDKDRIEYTLSDKWIMSRLNRTIEQTRDALENYRFNEGAHFLYQFVWHEFCDWYIELIKPYLFDKADSKLRLNTQHVLLGVLNTVLCLLHPFMPFITEEIWSKLPNSEGSITVHQYPKSDSNLIDEKAEAEMNLIIDIVGNIRNVRGEMNIPPATQVETFLYTEDQETYDKLERNKDHIKNLARIGTLSMSSDKKEYKSSATAVVDKVEIFVPLKGIIDFYEEEKRLKKESDKIEKKLILLNKKLSNEDFLSKAPPHVIEDERIENMKLIEKKRKFEEGIHRMQELQRER
ncbi:MAG: valine--tRNA ligase [Deltaproteobacteria bacterium CG_4_9_14_3_um_filter_44_9]|nr:MAG: valine--tRNA ligase [Deltaproteobacteria bacterium CG2_30_43_15]PIU85993.1 MAG: valine--tRNA ligase [Deltaproteobacteria bacterium CG06_land_8_20_14_3_00_44_19]PJB39184.1 MAG: valine--tRNA ligase [Deltaproteobacteria bacterium CG_4_9_14_3_um_filter_44_9]